MNVLLNPLTKRLKHENQTWAICFPARTLHHYIFTHQSHTSTQRNHNNDIQTASVVLDVEKAIDRVWNEGLLYKLTTLDIPTAIVKIIESFLTGRIFQNKIENGFSTTRHIPVGVPQDSYLQPTHYQAYVNDMSNTSNAQLALSTDNTMFLTQNKNAKRAAVQLQHQLNLVFKFFHRWRIEINPHKTASIIFGHTRTTYIPPLINRQPHDKLVKLR